MSEPSNEPIQKPINVKLSDAELIQRGDELVAAIAEWTAVDGERSATAKSYKERLDGIETKRDKIAKAISDRCEERMIACKLVPDYRGGIMNYEATEAPWAGQVVDSRPLEPNELQTTIPDAAPADQEPPAGGKGKRGKKGRGHLQSVPAPAEGSLEEAEAAAGIEPPAEENPGDAVPDEA